MNNADLAAAASAAIANLIHDHDLSAEAVGAALSAAFPLGVDSGELAVSTLIKAAPRWPPWSRTHTRSSAPRWRRPTPFPPGSPWGR